MMEVTGNITRQSVGKKGLPGDVRILLPRTALGSALKDLCELPPPPLPREKIGKGQLSVKSATVEHCGKGLGVEMKTLVSMSWSVDLFQDRRET